MSAQIHTSSSSSVGPSSRIAAAFRLHFTVPSTFISVPLLVFASASLIALGIMVWISQQADRAHPAAEPLYNGASQATVWCLAFMAAYAVTHTFPFSMALSFSRRTFVVASMLAFAAVSAVFGAAFALMASMEQWTKGYGMHVYTFNLPYLTQGPGGVFSAGLVAAALCLVVMLLCFSAALIYRRLGLMLFWAVMIAAVALLAVLAMIITTGGWWGDVWLWLVEQSALSLAGWLMMPAAVFTGVSWVTIRRVSPSA